MCAEKGPHIPKYVMWILFAGFFPAFVNPVSTVWKAVVLKYMCLLVLVIKIILLVVCMYKL